MFAYSRLLVRHPQVLERLRAEIENITKQKKELSREDLKKMIYLSNVLKESMSTQNPLFRGLCLP